MSHDFDRAMRDLSKRHVSEPTRRRHLEMFACLAASRDRRRRRRRIAILTTCGVLGLSAAGVGTAAALGVFAQAPTDRHIAHCYATPDLHDPGNYSDISILDGSSLGDVAKEAIDICHEQWRLGQLNKTSPKVRPPQAETIAQPAPSLIACVLPSGQVGVFPGNESTCASLNLPLALP